MRLPNGRRPSLNVQILLGCITYIYKKQDKTKRARLLLKMDGSSKLWDLDTDENDET